MASELFYRFFSPRILGSLGLRAAEASRFWRCFPGSWQASSTTVVTGLLPRCQRTLSNQAQQYYWTLVSLPSFTGCLSCPSLCDGPGLPPIPGRRRASCDVPTRGRRLLVYYTAIGLALERQRHVLLALSCGSDLAERSRLQAED
jgi:hypothetical protein